jgi:hypothetical protein
VEERRLAGDRCGIYYDVCLPGRRIAEKREQDNAMTSNKEQQ